MLSAVAVEWQVNRWGEQFSSDKEAGCRSFASPWISSAPCVLSAVPNPWGSDGGLWSGMASPFFSSRSSIRIYFSRMPSSTPPPFKSPRRFIYVRDPHQFQTSSKSNFERIRILKRITYTVKYLMCHPRVIMGQVLELLVHAVHFDV